MTGALTPPELAFCRKTQTDKQSKKQQLPEQVLDIRHIGLADGFSKYKIIVIDYSYWSKSRVNKFTEDGRRMPEFLTLCGHILRASPEAIILVSAK
jgi:hypothetical protein